MKYLTRSLIVSSLACLIATVIFWVALFLRDWWGLIDPAIENAGRFRFFPTMRKHGAAVLLDGFLLLAALWVLSLILSSTRLLGKLGHFVINTSFLFAFAFGLYGFYWMIQENVTLRTPVGSTGYLDPSKIYILISILSLVVTIIISLIFLIGFKVATWRKH